MQARRLAEHPAVTATLAWLRLHLSAIERFAQKHRRVVAVAVSLALHIGVMLLFLIDLRTGFSARGDKGMGAQDGSGLAVEMVSSNEVARMLTAVKAPEEVKPEDEIIPMELAQDDVALDAIKPLDVADMSSDSHPPQPLSPSEAASGGNGNNGTDDDALWQAIAPCWQSVADADTLPVTLEISFDAEGGIASPPRIERNLAVANDPRAQRSEVLALQALSKCGAYAMAEGRTDVKVIFPSP